MIQMRPEFIVAIADFLEVVGDECDPRGMRRPWRPTHLAILHDEEASAVLVQMDGFGLEAHSPLDWVRGDSASAFIDDGGWSFADVGDCEVVSLTDMETELLEAGITVIREVLASSTLCVAS